ncbi:MAG: zf-HC2 domain-containing protein [Oscillospiraceae bacterium]|nr:zf-HC2 domain-containing protein [Oscillospiraceae bacterium]
MNMTCNFAKDLAELYHENLVSPETADAIRSHLKTCADCRKYYREFRALQNQKSMDKIQIFSEKNPECLPNPEFSDLSETEKRLCETLSRRLRRRRFWGMVGTSAVIGAGSVMLTIGLFLTYKGRDQEKFL